MDQLQNKLEERDLKRSGLKKERDRLYKHLEMEEHPVDKDETDSPTVAQQKIIFLFWEEKKLVLRFFFLKQEFFFLGEW